MVNSREAKRIATTMLARFAHGRAEDGRQALSEGFYPFAPEVIDAADTERVCRAFAELAEELERRLTGARRPTAPPIDPAQLSWLDLEAVVA